VSDDKIKTLSDMLNAMVNRDKLAIGTSSWTEQFKAAIDPKGGDPDAKPSFMLYFGHFVALPWKVFFALIPPTHFCGGWFCFFIALIFIGFVTAIIADLASLFGCVMGLKDSITAITFVALGTSLPDTFASKAAAVGDEYADNSIGNVTGSNSVNVFLGLGMPWLIAAVYWSMQDCKGIEKYVSGDVCYKWNTKYAADVASGDVDGFGFVVLAGDLVTSVVCFSVCATTALLLLVYRRDHCGGELGGPLPAKKRSAAFLIGLWFIYLTVSILTTTKKIDAI